LQCELATPHTIQQDGDWMVPMTASITEFRPKTDEKITINIGHIDLGRIDLLVAEGFYSNRTDFIRTAIRNQLDHFSDAVATSAKKRQLAIGLRHYSREELETARAAGKTLRIQALGLVVIAPDVAPDLARSTIASVEVLGALQASSAVKAALRDRIH
jgi:Arc/MetJ-type ribon-helix-helix transcriptional regulator